MPPDEQADQTELARLRRREAELEAEVAQLRAGMREEGSASPGSLNAALQRVNAELRRSQAELQKSSELHRLILESATDYAIFSMDLSGRVTSWNEGARRTLGWEEAEILGQPGSVIFLPEDRATGLPGAEMDIALEHGRAEGERWHVRKDGSRFWARGQMMPLRDGEVRGFLKILRDRTEERRSQQEAELAEARAADLLEAMGDAFMAMDRDFRIVQVNGRAIELEGRSREDLLGQVHWDLWPASVGTPLEAAYRRCLEERVPVTLENHYVSDHRDTWFEIRAYPTADGIVVFYRDISDRKRDEHVLRMRARRLEIVSETAARFLDTGDPDEVLRSLFQSLADEFGIDAALSFVADEGENALHLAARFGLPPEVEAEVARIDMDGSSVCGHVACTRRAMYVGNVQASDDPRTGIVRRHGIRAYAAFPLLAAERLLGTLSFGTRRRDRFSNADLLFMGTLAQQAAAARERLRAETELRQQTDLLATITEHAAEALFLMDPEGRITFANPAAEQMFGWQRGELMGRALHDLLHHHHEDGQPYSASECPLVRALSSGEVLRGHEDVFFRKTGDTVDVACSNAPILVEGRVTGAVLVVHDITERRRAVRALAESEARLRESEGRFRLLASSSPAIIWLGHQDGTLSYLNDAWYEYTGLTAEESLPLGWDRILHPEDAGTLLTAWQKARSEGGIYAVDCRFRRHDGAYRWFQIRGMPVRDTSGEITVWLGNNTDIHDRRTLADALLAINEALEARVAERTADLDRMWRLSTDIMLVGRFDSTMTAVNPAWRTLLGWSEAELLGSRFLDLIHPEDREASTAAVGQLAEGARVLHFQNRYRHKDGSYRWISWTGVPDESFIHAVGRDITAEKIAAEELERAQEQLRQSQKMEAVGQLTGGLAHDFNNLLTGITGSLDLIGLRIARGQTQDLSRYLEAAQSSAQRAATLTHRLLAFSRRQTLDPKPTGITRLVSSMEDLIRRSVGPAIQVETAIPPDLWMTLCDPNQLENALLNLAINGRDAMPDGGRLTIEAVNKSLGDPRAARLRGVEPGEYVMVSVTDTGTGMPPEVAERAFEPFYTTKPLGQGTGLGLSMVYGFAQQSGGRVRITSEVGRGTAVHIYLPRYVGETVADVAAEAPSGALGAGAKGSVLVVDDEPVIRMLVTEVLEELGYDTIEAADGPEGLRILQSPRRLDLLVTDVGLPGGVNGRQLADAARQHRPGLKVLFITGYAENAVIGNVSLEPGMQVITKPFAMTALASRIRAMTGDALNETCEP
ncbi:PAS domain S-box protein [Teichococcus wenyumeiae]|nr:PAS domain S-box protein [Pseudoroseomonas wenyumeiae]